MRRTLIIFIALFCIPLASAALTDNLDAYYHMDDNTKIDDATGVHADATLSNPSYTATGFENGAYSFNGASDTAFLDNAITADDFSMCGWFYSDNLASDDYILGSANRYMYVTTGTSTKIPCNSTEYGFGWYDTSFGDDRETCAKGYAATTWTHLCFIKDGTNDRSRVYVNGINTTRTGHTGTITLLEKMNIGSFNDGSKWWAGDVDELGFWTDYALTDTQVQQLYNSGNGFFYPFVTDSCTYTSGDWYISDICRITSDVNVDAGAKIIVSSGAALLVNGGVSVW